MIVIDTREKFKEEILEKLVKKLPEVPIKIKKVKYGDYYIRRADKSEIWIERKSLADIGNQKNLGVMLKRNEKARENCENFFLMIEWGDPKTYIKDGYVFTHIKSGKVLPSMSLNQLNAALFKQCEKGIPILYSYNIDDSINWLEYLWTVEIGDQDWYCRKSPISILNNIYGVGPTKAKQVMKKYGSVGEAMVNCREWLPKRSMEWLFYEN